MTDPSHAAARLPLSLAELRDVLDGAWIVLRYQPVVRMADRRPVALEALARVQHPRRGLVTPDLFVPQMEEAGLGWALTQAVVRRAFADWGGNRLAAIGVSLAINIPLDVLLMPDTLDWIETARAAAGIDASLLTLELTESQPVSRVGELGDALTRTRALGYGLAIDDVGPLVRDHGPLLDMGFSFLKLDKDLVRGSAADTQLDAFLARALDAARAARLTVIAEGVEDESVWRRMAARGVEQAQGYLIARPMPAETVAAWREAWLAADPPAGTGTP